MSRNYRAQLVGLFGFPVDENPTGAVMEAAFESMGLNFRYLTALVKPEDLQDAMRGLRGMNMRGVNLTIPHKVTVLPFLDTLSQAAEIIGAVNTVVNDAGRLTGENTDGKGMLKSLRENGRDPAGKGIALLGAGGAARAVAAECALAGAKSVTVINRSRERGEDLARLIREKTNADACFLPWSPGIKIPEGTDILINCTPVGLYPCCEARPDVDETSINPGMTVCDAVFNPPRTAFLQLAEARGAKTINGLGMLVNQAALNFTLWTGRTAPAALMERALKAEFGLE